MTCQTICLSVSCVAAPGCAPWLHSGSKPGPRSPRIHSFTGAASGVVVRTATNWMPDGSQATALRDLLAGREALIEELAQRRRKHRATSSTLADLRLVTEALMQMGVR
jgi:hypothetical protein